MAHDLLTVSGEDRVVLSLSERLIFEWSSTVALLMVRADQAARILDDPSIVALGKCLDQPSAGGTRHIVH